MSTNYRNLVKLMTNIKDQGMIEQIVKQKSTQHELDSIDTSAPFDQEGQSKRLQQLQDHSSSHYLSDNGKIDDLTILKGKIENFIGFTKVPTGIAGPLLVNGTHAQGQFSIPLATTEGALVASYSRGCKAASLSGGITSICMTESVQRSPLFKFSSIVEVGMFLAWIIEQYDQFITITKSHTSHGKLINFKTNVEGNQVNLVFEFETGDAAGQNMVTFCTAGICEYILENSPVKPTTWYIESNFSGDKKSNYQSFQSVRGKKVVAEVIIPKYIVRDVLKSDPKLMEDYWKTSTVSLVQIGSIGTQGHIANGLTALFMATGQDVACISEAQVAVNRFEVTPDGDLYASLTMPNLIVGTVGGGTGLPTQRECLELMDCYGTGKAKKFAEICCALALAGELSIAAAIASGHFVSAHKSLGRS